MNDFRTEANLYTEIANENLTKTNKQKSLNQLSEELVDIMTNVIMHIAYNNEKNSSKKFLEFFKHCFTAAFIKLENDLKDNKFIKFKKRIESMKNKVIK